MRSRICSPSGYIEALEERSLLNFAPFGAGGTIASAGSVSESSVASSRNGTYVVATSDRSGNVSSITVTRFAIDGAPLGAPIAVFSLTSSTPVIADVSSAIDDDGDAVVAFRTRENGDTSKIYFSRLSSGGVVSPPALVDSATSPNVDSGIELLGPAVSMGSGGAFIIGWTSMSSRNDNEARFRAYDAVGAPRAPVFAVNTTNLNFTGAASMSIDVTPDANSAAFAYVFSGTDLNISNVIFGRISTSGLTGSAHTVSNPATLRSTYREPSVASLANGSYVLEYQRISGDPNADATETDLFAERYDASSVRQGNAIWIGDSLGTIGSDNAVATLPDGGFVAAFSAMRDGVVTLYAQRFDASGTPDEAGPADVDARANSGDVRLYSNIDVSTDGYGTTLVGYVQPIANAGAPAGASIGAATAAEYRRLTGALAIVEEGVLYVVGTRRSDSLVIRKAASGTITVRNAIVEIGTTKRFGGSANIASISVDGFNGIDYITNDTPLDMIARGGSGNDYFYGGSGSDVLRGNTGDDVLLGNDGDDRILGDAGNDSARGGRGNDALDGGDGNDELRGDAGDDHVTGGNGDDRLIGSAGSDVLIGESGNDRLYGQENDDYLDGGAGRDFLAGDEGDDRFLTRDGTLDTLIGGAGNDPYHADSIDDLSAVERRF